MLMLMSLLVDARVKESLWSIRGAMGVPGRVLGEEGPGKDTLGEVVAVFGALGDVGRLGGLR